MQNEGRPLWDGVSKIRLRRASDAEAEKWNASEIEEDDERQHAFLVPVVDPSDDKFDDDDDDSDHDHD